MPTTRTRRRQQPVEPPSETALWIASDGLYPKPQEAAIRDVLVYRYPHFRRDRPRCREFWSRVRDCVLTDWIARYPGMRPWYWWSFDAPRWDESEMPAQFRNQWYTHALAEPRRRLGGVGTSVGEIYSDTELGSLWAWGIPVDWEPKTEKLKCDGTKEPVPLHPDFVPIDWQDPPTFESEAAYLERHGLFVRGERDRLQESAFGPEVLGDRCFWRDLVPEAEG